MPFFRYRGWSKSGRKIRGEIDAFSVEGAEKELKERGYYGLRVSPVPKDLFENTWLEKKVSERELAVFSRQFATMVGAGISILEALRLLARQSGNRKLQRSLVDIRSGIEQGAALHEAMARHPDVFDTLYVSMLKAAEMGGVVGDVLFRLCDYLEKSVQLKARVKNAMIYPVIVLLVAFVVLFFVLLYVVPSFEDIFLQTGQALPLPTATLLRVSHFFQDNFFTFLGGTSLAGCTFVLFASTKSGRRLTDYARIFVPVYGTIYRKAIMARFARKLGAMLSSGVSLLGALGVVAGTTGNRVVEEVVVAAAAEVARGETLGAQLEDAGLFPLMFVHMVEVGENSGTLDTTLVKLADFFDDEVAHAVANSMALLEPFLLVVIGGIVGTLIIALYLPIFQMGALV